ncbi:MAG: phage holin family protein [Patulibacter sp.]|nr:phage holin family protein [Patulibacter sp.]
MSSPDSTRDERPIGQLVQDLSQQTATLVRQELRLAQVEMQQKGKRAGAGIGLFGGAGLFAVLGLGTLVAGAVLALATAVAPWLSAVIVALLLFAVAGVAALIGKREVTEATPPVPEQAIESTQQDVQEIKHRSHRA